MQERSCREGCCVLKLEKETYIKILEGPTNILKIHVHFYLFCILEVYMRFFSRMDSTALNKKGLDTSKIEGRMADARFSHIMTTVSLEINSQAFVTIAD